MTRKIKNICVFCGASPGARPDYALAARILAAELVKRDIGLVYGGGKVGIMGELAKSMLEKGGRVTGVIPKSLSDRKVGFDSLPDLRVVGSMHERKALMAELSDGFIALPGGIGTIEEFFEMMTWAQLGFHSKPCALLNTAGFYDKLSEFLRHLVDENFLEEEHRSMVIVENSPSAVLDRFASYKPPVADKAAWAIKMTASSMPD